MNIPYWDHDKGSIPFPIALRSERRWILTGEVEWGEPEGKACRTCACGRLEGSTQAGVPHQSYQVPRSFPKSVSETTKKEILTILP